MVALCSAGQAHAQAAPEAPQADDAAAAPGDAIVVTGYRQSIEKSLEQKREANSLIEVITAGDIGKFPDKNVADAQIGRASLREGVCQEVLIYGVAVT